MTASRLPVWVAPHTLRWFKEGEHCTDPSDGDIILVRHLGLTADGIALGQKALALLAEPELEGFTWNDHVAFIRHARGFDTLLDTGEPLGAGEWVVSEMGPRGHEYRPLEDYADRLYCVVTFEVPLGDIAKVLMADDRCRDITYGWLQYPALVLDGISGGHLAAAYGTTMICSTEVTFCAQNLYFTPDRQGSGVVPAHISYWLGAKCIDGEPVLAA